MNRIIKTIDTFWTIIGTIILMVCLIVALPFVILMEYLDGER